MTVNQAECSIQLMSHSLGVSRTGQRMCESLLATLERELLDLRGVKTKAEARVACFEFIEGWCDPSRRHSALGGKSPINYERTAAEGLASLSEKPSTKPGQPHLYSKKANKAQGVKDQ